MSDQLGIEGELHTINNRVSQATLNLELYLLEKGHVTREDALTLLMLLRPESKGHVWCRGIELETRVCLRCGKSWAAKAPIPNTPCKEDPNENPDA